MKFSQIDRNEKQDNARASLGDGFDAEYEALVGAVDAGRWSNRRAIVGHG